MKIARIRIRNFAGIEDFEIDAGNVNLVSARNAQGKTSILRAIEMAFRTKKIEPNVVRTGEPKAEILVELDSGLKVERTISGVGSPVIVKNGKVVQPKPQSVLNAMIGQDALGFNPIEFFEASAREQREMLLRAIDVRLSKEEWGELLGPSLLDGGIVGLNLQTIEQEAPALDVLEDMENLVYAARTAANAEVVQAQKVLVEVESGIPAKFDPEPFRTHIRDLYAEKSGKENQIAEVEKRQAELAQARRTVEARKEALRIAEAQLDAEEKRCATLEKFLEEADVPDISEIQEKIDRHEAGQAIAAKWDEARKLEKREREAAAKADNLDRLYKRLTGEIQRKILARAKLPIEDITVKADGVYVSGRPVKRLSTSEGILFSVQLARALAGDLKVLCIDGAESLDKVSYSTLMKEIVGDPDFQYFVTEVSDGPLTVEKRA